MKDDAGNTYFASKIYEGTPEVTNTLIEMHKYNGTSWQTVYSVNFVGGIGGTFYTANIGNQIFSILDEHFYSYSTAQILKIL